MNKIVCIVGMAGSGKGEVSKFFVNRGFGYFRFGQPVLDEAIKKGSVNEETEREIRNGFRKQYGMAAMAILNEPIINELLQKGNVLGDGLYSWDEYKYLKERYGENLIILAVCASPKVRYARLLNRKYDPEKDKQAKNRAFTPEGAKARDFHEIEEVAKGGPIAMANYFVINEGSLEELSSQLLKIYNNLLF